MGIDQVVAQQFVQRVEIAVDHRLEAAVFQFLDFGRSGVVHTRAPLLQRLFLSYHALAHAITRWLLAPTLERRRRQGADQRRIGCSVPGLSGQDEMPSPYPSHPQLIADFLTIEETALEMLDELKP
jgi:hypothetical protein